MINLPVLLFSVALAVMSGIVSGLAPAFQFSKPQVAQLIQSSSRRMAGGSRGKRTHNLLVASQIALTLLLLTSAAAAVSGFIKLTRAELGYEPHNVMSVGIPVHQNTHGSWGDRSSYFNQILAHVQALPGVVSAGISSNATPPSNGWRIGFEILGQPSAHQDEIRANFVSPEYFSVLRIPLLEGRLWDRPEVARGARMAVINQSMARKYWPHGDALGKQVRIPEIKSRPPFMFAVANGDQWLEIVGVVADALDDGLRNPVKPAAYVPYTLSLGMWTQVLVRTQASPLAMLNQVRAAIKTVDPDQQAAGNTRDLEQWIEREDAYAYGRLVAALFTAISLVALLLAAIGLFSVVSYGVAQRTNELGIRMALGASRTQVLRVVLSGIVVYVAGGLAGGTLLSLSLSRVLSKWAEGSFYNPFVVSAVTLLLILTAAVAAVIPARRASSIDPMEALRYD